MHDPTTLNRQGNDIGTQYRSALFYYNEDQLKIAGQVKDRIQLKINKPIVTTFEKASAFFIGEDYHQKYLENNYGGYCNHRLHW
ncbi:peptide methionine sulfoxide reductase [Acrasis kona]|uniref:peptide-methionine (S)-S-oxide reductase n=1 Tax=Acrasis kona TaxID=1008807 RepID=A0AAW2Z0E3_9EUKA